MKKQYDTDGREYTPFIVPTEVPATESTEPASEPAQVVPTQVPSTTGLNEPAATESTEPASEPAQSKE